MIGEKSNHWTITSPTRGCVLCAIKLPYKVSLNEDQIALLQVKDRIQTTRKERIFRFSIYLHVPENIVQTYAFTTIIRNYEAVRIYGPQQEDTR